MKMMSVHEIKKQEHLEKSNKSINKNEAHPISACTFSWSLSRRYGRLCVCCITDDFTYGCLDGP